MKIAALALVAGVLTGCAVLEDKPNPQAHFATLQQKCLNYGFKPGTDSFANCVRQEDLCAQQRDAASAALYGNLAQQRGTNFNSNLRGALARTDTSNLCR